MRRVLAVLLFLLVGPVSAWAGFEVPPYEPLKVVAKVPAYRVKPDLSNVVNRKQFGQFTSLQKQLLAKNGFFAAPADDKQLYFVYENNDYLLLPSFVACDAVLQLYHIFYDYTLREMEGERLIPLCRDLTEHMLAESLATYRALPEGEVKRAALKNVAYLGVAAKALGISAELPAPAAEMVGVEWKQIMAHEGRMESAIFPFSEDYSQYVPRGHYTRNENLQQYFRAMMWFGRMPFPLEWPQDGTPPVIAYEQIRQSLLITRALYETELQGKPPIAAWERIYEPTAFYVETADDLTPEEWRGAALEIWGHLPSAEELGDEGKLRAFHDEAVKLRASRIATFPKGEMGLIDMPTGPQFRFMGQRSVPDSYMLQQLVFSYVGTEMEPRAMPLGLDVFAALGSQRAYGHLKRLGETKYANYEKQMGKLRVEFAAKKDRDWRKNLYWGWVWVLKGLTEPFGAGYPSFMRNDAWLDKELNTALANWAELRHDTILYAKQSYTAEGGGEEKRPLVKGYVEPVAEVYHRLVWLTQATRKGLRARDLLTPALDESFGRMEDLLTFLEGVSVKELGNQPLTAAEYERIRWLGAELESLTTMVSQAIGGAEGGLITEADEDMAVIADVHTDMLSGNCLEEAVGHGSHIYVVAPIAGKLYLTRGAVFSYFEFPHPMGDRLTDEAWQEMLKSGKAAKPPAWTGSFLTGPKAKIPAPKVTRSSGGGC